MSALLYGVGALAVVAGAVMIGFGIPINEFSFGNTLIGAGVTAVAGGLVVLALGVVVAQLKRLNDTLAMRAPVRPDRPLDVFENANVARNVPAAARMPFPPPKPKADAALSAPPAFEAHEDHEHAETPPEPQSAPAFAPPPMLRNPEEAPVTVEDDVSLSPSHPMAAVARGPGGREADTVRTEETHRYEPKPETGWRPPAPAAPPPRQPPMHFDTMWPEPKPAKGQASADVAPAVAPARPAEPDRPPARPAILKSGVVDGMGYTLYVDGSIEAELPQGTLRFSSINELRSHLEKNS